MKHLPGKLLAGALTVFSLQAAAAVVEVQWSDPAEFRDIRVIGAGQERFEQQVMNDLEQIFQENASLLEQGQTLRITVEDLDLAGEVEYFHSNFPQGLRVVRDVDSPAISLRYELHDANGTVIKSGAERLRDIGFNYDTLTQLDRTSLRHEKRMIEDWFEEAF